ncbi:MAG: DUF3784 domain-containing protein [Euryarchaeota archaeon]|nr:DUF3784 domain-containing protein [Euryarchaeota archaeon]
MDRDVKAIVSAVIIGLLAPIVIIALLVANETDIIDIVVQGILLFSILPIIALSAYMWITGKGASLIAGYNTSPKAVRDQYDSEKLAKFIGKLLFFSMIPMIVAIETIFFLEGMWIFWILLAVSMAILIIGMIYMNTGGRFLKEGAIDPKLLITEDDKKDNRRILYAVLGISIIITAIVVIIIFFIAPSGNLTAELQDDSLQVKASMVNELIAYDDITNVEYRDKFDTGRRIAGFGGTNINSGKFKNAEFGTYTLASHNKVSAHIIVYHSNNILAFNLDTVEDTLSFYDQLINNVK